MIGILTYFLFPIVFGFPWNIVAFFLLQLMPTYRWLFTLSAILLGLTVFVYFRYALALQDRGDIFAILALYMIGYAVVIGAMTRFLVLHCKSKGLPIAKRGSITVFGFCLFIVIPVIYTTISKHLSDWQKRPPPPACNHHQIHVRMNSTIFIVPGLPFVHLATGDGNEKLELEQIQQHNIYFHGNKDVRRYCDKYENGAIEVEANALTIDFKNIPRAVRNPDYVSYCEQHAADSNAFCPIDPRNYPIRDLHLYLEEKYNAGKMFATWPSTPEKTQEEIVKANATLLENGLYQAGSRYYWVADSDWTTPDGKPFAMSCYKSQDNYYCKSTYRFAGEIFVHYGFLVNRKMPIADARKIYDTAQTILSGLRIE